MRNELPDLRHFVFRRIFVCGDECHLLGNGCCNEQTVEGVSVVHRQSFKSGKVIRFYGENGYIVLFCKTNKTSRFSIKVKLSYANFYSKLWRTSNVNEMNKCAKPRTQYEG